VNNQLQANFFILSVMQFAATVLRRRSSSFTTPTVRHYVSDDDQHRSD